MRKESLNSIFYGKRYIAFSAILSVLAAFALHLFLQYRIESFFFIEPYPLLFVYTSLMLLCVIVCLSALTGNVFLGSAVVAGVIILVTFADRNKYAMRGEHVYPDDIATTNNLGDFSGMYDKGEFNLQILFMVGIAAFAIAMTVIIVRVRKKAGMYDRPSWSGRVLLKRLMIRLAVSGIAAAVLLLMTTPFVTQDSEFAKRLGFHNYQYSQNTNYAYNGFIAAFVSNLSLASMKEPVGYSEAAVRKIVEKYSALAAQGNEGRVRLSTEGVDIIFILNESFTDPFWTSDIIPYSGGDPVPNLHDLAKAFPSATLQTVQFGGGTANVEFEALTGFSMFFAGSATVAYQEFFRGKNAIPSIASYLKEYEDYETVGMHPFEPGMFKRSTVYPKLGYAKFMSYEDFKHKEKHKEAYYVSDISAYDEVFDILDESGGDGDMFVTLVTMQNHGIYGKQLEDHPFSVRIASAKPDDQESMDDYLALLHISDAALGELADRIVGREKKTMAVFFGDHLPTIYNDYIDDGDERKYQTPLLILSNIGNQGFHIDTISPNYIPNIIFDYVGAKKPPFYYLLDDAKNESPILTRNYFASRPYPEISGALADYMMIEYDIVAGKKWAEKMGFFMI